MGKHASRRINHRRIIQGNACLRHTRNWSASRQPARERCRTLPPCPGLIRASGDSSHRFSGGPRAESWRCRRQQCIQRARLLCAQPAVAIRGFPDITVMRARTTCNRWRAHLVRLIHTVLEDSPYVGGHRLAVLPIGGKPYSPIITKSASMASAIFYWIVIVDGFFDDCYAVACSVSDSSARHCIVSGDGVFDVCCRLGDCPNRFLPTFYMEDV